MKATRNEQKQTGMLEQFTANSLTHKKMLIVRGGDDSTNDDGGSTQDRQEDGFN